MTSSERTGRSDQSGRRAWTRREFLTTAGLAGLGGVLAACGQGQEGGVATSPTPGTAGTPATEATGPTGEFAVAGASPEERALNLIERLKSDGVVSEGDEFVVMHHSGQRNNLEPALEEWNQQTGLNFVSSEVGQEADIFTKAMNEATAQTGDIDIFLAFVNWRADMFEANLIVDQTEWWDSYGPEVTEGDNPYISPLDDFTSLYKGNRVAMGADNDTFAMFYRTDLMEQANAQEFEDTYGRPLEVPTTWEEFDEWVEFFDRPDQGVRGTHILGTRFFAYTGWAARFISKGGAYFDDEMEPLIVSDAGVTAAEELRALFENHMHDDAVSGDWTAAYSRFPAGEVFSAWAWASLAKFAADPEESQIAGDFAAMNVPGSMHDGTLSRAVPHVVGWSYSVSQHGKAPEAAYAFIQWFCGPQTGLDAISRQGTLDPFREGWYEEEAMVEAYGAEVLPVLLDDTQAAFPDIALEGANEYLDVLNVNLQQAFGGQKGVEAALSDTAEEWQNITDRLDRESQIEAWNNERQNYPSQIQDLWEAQGVFA